MEHITIQPTKVRGHGNVLNPKPLEEYQKIKCELSLKDNIFSLIPLFFDLRINNSAIESTEFYSNTNLVLSASVRYSNGEMVDSDERLKNQRLQLYVDGEQKYNGTITNYGDWTHNYSLGKLSVGTHFFQLKFKDTWSQIFKINITQSAGSVTLTQDKSETYGGENITFTATVKDSDNNLLPNQTVKFYNPNTTQIYFTGVTDENGECSFSYTRPEPSIQEIITVRAVCTDVYSNALTGAYWTRNPQSLSCEIDKTECYVGDPVSMVVTFYDHFQKVVDGEICITGANNNEYSIEKRNDKYYITYIPASQGTKSLKIAACTEPYRVYANKEIIATKYNADFTVNCSDFVASGRALHISTEVLKEQTPRDADIKVYVNGVLKTTFNSKDGYDCTGLPRGTSTIKIALDDPRYDYEEVTRTVCCGATVTINDVIFDN